MITTQQEKVDVEIIHDIVLSFFESYSAKDLTRIIEAGLVPNAKYVMSVIPDVLKGIVKRYWESDEKRVLSMLTVERVVTEVHEHRTDLISVINQKRTKIWLKIFLKDMVNEVSRL